MGRKPKNAIKFICPKCGTEPVADKEKSNENWLVFKPICETCGSKYEIKIDG